MMVRWYDGMMVRWFATTVLLFPNIHNPKKHVHKLVCKPAKSLVQLNRRFNSSKTTSYFF